MKSEVTDQRSEVRSREENKYRHPGKSANDYSYYDFDWRETKRPPLTMRTVIVDLAWNQFAAAVYVNGKWFGFGSIEWDGYNPKGVGHWITESVKLYQIKSECIRRWKDLPHYDDHPVP